MTALADPMPPRSARLLPEREAMMRDKYACVDDWHRELLDEVEAQRNDALVVLRRAEKAERERDELEVTRLVLIDQREKYFVAFSQAEAERVELVAKLNTPEIEDFARGVELESVHQRERWGSEHDGGKTPADWFWLVGYLAGKALHAVVAGHADKAKHHMITTAAALCNWHAALLGKTSMRPGIAEPQEMGEGP